MKEPPYTREILRLAASIPYLEPFDQLEGATERRAPTCGSRMRVAVEVDWAGRVSRFRQAVEACAYGQATAALVGGHAMGRSKEEVGVALADDLNTPLALSRLSAIDDPADLKASAHLLGLLTASEDEWFRGEGDSGDIETRIIARTEAKARRDFAEADRIRDELKAEGILLEDSPSGTTWRRE